MGSTIKDVAKKAGVAPSTVSRVIHKHPKISKETKIRVRQAMKELGYHPNAAARSLARGKTHTLGLIIPNSEEELFVKPFFILAMRGLSIAARRKGYNIMFSFSNNEREEVESLKQFAHQNIVDAVILMTSRNGDKSMACLEEENCPYVVIGQPDRQFHKALWVDNDNRKAMYLMVQYFLNRGKKRIAFLGGPESFMVTRNRLTGYREALASYGIPNDENLIYMGKGFQETSGYEGAKKLLGTSSPDAIVAADDFLAMGVLDYMKESGRMIPLSGFNNSMKGSLISPSLTSVDIQSEKLGASAAELLIGNLESQNERRQNLIVETKLIERESSLLK